MDFKPGYNYRNAHIKDLQWSFDLKKKNLKWSQLQILTPFKFIRFDIYNFQFQKATNIMSFLFIWDVHGF